MLFNSFEFLFLFLPATLFVYHRVPARCRTAVLAAAAVVFYGASGVLPLTFLLLGVVWTYFFGIVLSRSRSGWVMALAVSGPLATLFLFRYLAFSLDALDVSEEGRQPFRWFLSVLLPAGISFYTFQMIGYLIDVRDGVVPPERRPIMLLSFITFFPHLIAGPILRYADIAGQLRAVDSRADVSADWMGGAKLVALGLFFKIFFADLLAVLHARVDLHSADSALDAAFSVLSYSFRIYYDFWAYSVVAIGLGRFLGVSLPRNFIEPYLSPNPKVFWRRWHVTLSFWLRDYVYLKLGGNRRYAVNIVVVFALCGLWHGAGWNFLVWGLYHAALVLLYTAARPVWDLWPRPLQIAVTFILVSLGWPLFYLPLAEWVQLFEVLAIRGAWQANVTALRDWLVLGVVAIFTFYGREDRWLYNQRRVAFVDNPAVLGLMLGITALCFSWGQTFIYFRF